MTRPRSTAAISPRLVPLLAAVAPALLLAGCQGASSPRPDGEIPAALISGHAEVIDGQTLEIESQRIRLTGIDAPAPDQLCRRDSGLPYRCGQDSMQALASRIARQLVSCETRREIGSAADALWHGRCEQQGLDIGEWLVRNGHAVAGEPRSLYAAAEAEARRARLGLWDGRFERP